MRQNTAHIENKLHFLCNAVIINKDKGYSIHNEVASDSDYLLCVYCALWIIKSSAKAASTLVGGGSIICWKTVSSALQKRTPRAVPKV